MFWDTLDPITLFYVGLLIGYMIASMIMQVIDSAIACILVCYSEQPAALANHNRTLYNLLTSTDF